MQVLKFWSIWLEFIKVYTKIKYWILFKYVSIYKFWSIH